jgi:hypothetical protein
MARYTVLLLSLVAAVCAHADTLFPNAMFGYWNTTETPQSVMGPLAKDLLGTANGGFSAFRDPYTGEVWFTVLRGQIFRVAGNKMQYCFGQGGVPGGNKTLAEQSPFSVNSTSETEVSFCWRTGLRGMPTHPIGCSGCSCAALKIQLTSTDTMELTFWQSPPVVHAHVKLARDKLAPLPTLDSAIMSTMDKPYEVCTFKDHYGPNVPGEPDLRPSARRRSGGCAFGFVSEATKQLAAMSVPTSVNSGTCRQLNGYNFFLDNLPPPYTAEKYDVPDVRFQYIEPSGPCDPCDVSYSVSAAVDDDQYIALGFKGQSWEHEFPYPPETPRPCYFGMCVDPYDNFTSDRIALGYASSSQGACVREMVMKDVVGEPSDVNYGILKNTSVERAGDRTIVRFTVSQHWPAKNASAIIDDGPFRVMWAIGKVSGDNGCGATIGFHGIQRGVAPINWLETLGSVACNYSAFEMGEM